MARPARLRVPDLFRLQRLLRHGHRPGPALRHRAAPELQQPVQGVSPSDFWRRWHMTLSLWLRDYLYITLGGNRCSPARRRVNVMATMVLGGLWHGANWTFAAWGAWHGVLLVAHQSTRAWDRMSPFWQRNVTFVLIT